MTCLMNARPLCLVFILHFLCASLPPSCQTPPSLLVPVPTSPSALRPPTPPRKQHGCPIDWFLAPNGGRPSQAQSTLAACGVVQGHTLCEPQDLCLCPLGDTLKKLQGQDAGGDHGCISVFNEKLLVGQPEGGLTLRRKQLV